MIERGENPGLPTLLYTHNSFYGHETGDYHPESARRLGAINNILRSPVYDKLTRIDAPRGDQGMLRLVHDKDYITSIFNRIPKDYFELVFLDEGDTVLSKDSGDAVLHGAGAVCDAVDKVMEGKAGNAFVALRPPGHHAEHNRAMGFCIFNNVAIGAEYAIKKHKIERASIVDFDVHHGNGTQNYVLSKSSKGLFYASSHQYPCYPGTGLESENGDFNNIVNVHLKSGSGSSEFRDGWRRRILPALGRFDPEIIFISAGFDAHHMDRLAAINLEVEDFAWVTDEIMNIADRHSNGRIVSVLEGGYDLSALAACAAAHVGALMGKNIK